MSMPFPNDRDAAREPATAAWWFRALAFRAS